MDSDREAVRFALSLDLAPGEHAQALGWEFVAVLNAGTVIALYKQENTGWKLHYWQPRTLSRWTRVLLEAQHGR